MRAESLPMMQTTEPLPLHDRRNLRDRLLQVLEEASRARAEGQYESLGKLVGWLREQRDQAEGWSLALIEVALRAVEATAGTSLPPEELALRAFVEDAEATGLGLLERLASPEVVSREDKETLGEGELALWQRLEDLGVITPTAKGYALSRRSFALARELVEPAILRSWRRVEECRGQIAYQRLDPASSQRLLEVRLGLSAGQAKQHLRRHPFERASQVAGFQRQPWTRQRPPAIPAEGEIDGTELLPQPPPAGALTAAQRLTPERGIIPGPSQSTGGLPDEVFTPGKRVQLIGMGIN